MTFTLRADLEETDEERLYLLADAGYVVSSVEVTPTGTTASKWQLAPDATGSAGTYGAAGAKLTVSGDVDDTNKSYFWAKASATDDETPVNDVSVTLVVTGIAAAE